MQLRWTLEPFVGESFANGEQSRSVPELQASLAIACADTERSNVDASATETPMKKSGILAALTVLTVGLLIAAEVEQRTIQTDTENFALSVPKEWPAFETNKTERNTIFYRIGPADTNYSIQLHFNNSLQIGTNRLVDSALENWLGNTLKSVLSVTVEKDIKTQRFGAKKDGVYARLTDRSPKIGEYRYYTRGVRLIGTNVLVFALVSNDKDFSALSNTLAVVESVKVDKDKGK